KSIACLNKWPTYSPGSEQPLAGLNKSCAKIPATFSDLSRKASATLIVTNPLPLPSIPETPTSTARLGPTAPRFRTIASTTRFHGTVKELPFDSLIRLGVLCCDDILTKRERDSIHAVAESGRGRSVLEDMS